MRKIKYLVSLTVLLLLCCVAVSANEVTTLDEYLSYTADMINDAQNSVVPMSMEEDSRFSCKRLIAEFADNAYLPHGIDPVDYVLYENTAVYSFGTAAVTEYAYNVLTELPDVVNVFADRIITLDSVTEAVVPAGDYDVIHPTLVGSNWGIEAVHASAYKGYVTGQNPDEIVVGIIDTGLATAHPYFKDSPRVVTGYNLTSPGSAVSDSVGHGTHVAGIISAATSDNIKIKMYQIFGKEDKTSNLLLVNAIRKAIADGVDVINISLGTLCENGFCHSALDEAYNAGIIVAVAAGNGGDDKIADPVADVCLGHYSEHLITVGAVNSSLVADTYSNYGPEVDICAPGTKIYSTYYDPKTATLGYVNMSGTSMATPFVASYAAMMKSVNSELTFESFSQAMAQSAMVPNGWDTTKNGVGILNMGQSAALIENLYTHTAQFVKDEELDEVSFNVQLENSTEDAVDFMIHLAFLNESKIQIGSHIECYNIKKDKKTNYSVPIEQLPDKTAFIKGYVWTDDMEPISMSREYVVPAQN